MDKPTPPLGGPAADFLLKTRQVELARSIEGLRSELQRTHHQGLELSRNLTQQPSAESPDRQIRRAALNLMEDAIAARTEALQINAQLKERIEEQERVEAALRETERELQTALELYKQLTIELDARVQERTRDLADREQRLRELTAELKRVEQQERQRLARILHDHVQQLLVAAKMRVDLIATNMADPVQGKLKSILAILGDAIDATRDLSVQLSPPLLHDQGLAAALNWLTGRMRGQYGMHIHLHIDHLADPRTPEERDILFQAAQEFLLNVAKHSQVKEVDLYLVQEGDRIVLEVRDQGIGFERGKAEHRGSFGLLQLHQRLTDAGGTLTIETASGAGTRAVAQLPYPVIPCLGSNSPADRR